MKPWQWKFHHNNSGFVRKQMDSFAQILCHFSHLQTHHLALLPYMSKIQPAFQPDVPYKSGNLQMLVCHRELAPNVCILTTAPSAATATSTLICPGETTQTIEVKRPIHIIHLPTACSATSPNFHLPPCYEGPYEIIDLLTEILPVNNNHIILGDFNIHINDNEDVEAKFFSESIEALGLKQHSITPTHKSDNILDLIFTEILSDIAIEVVETATYISDHCPVIATLNIKKEQVKQVQIVIHKTAKISQDKLNWEFNRLNVRWDSNLSSLVNQLSDELVRV